MLLLEALRQHRPWLVFVLDANATLLTEHIGSRVAIEREFHPQPYEVVCAPVALDSMG